MSWKSMQQAIDAVRDEGLERGLEQGLEQGIRQGIEQGVARGVERGRREAKLEDLRELVAWRFGAEALVAAELRLGADPEVRRTQQVMRWAYQADSAESFLHRINASLPD